MTSNADRARTIRIAEIIRKSIQGSENESAGDGDLFEEPWFKRVLLASQGFEVGSRNTESSPDMVR